MDISPYKYVERLNELLGRKKQLLLDISEITKQQTDTITEDGLDDLNRLIDDKQLKIEAINKLDEEFSVYFQRLKSTLGISQIDQLEVSKLEGAVSEGVKRLKEQTADILDIIKEIEKIEKVNSQKSKKLLDEFGDHIKRINRGKQANNAYKSNPVDVPSYFLDKKK